MWLTWRECPLVGTEHKVYVKKQNQFLIFFYFDENLYSLLKILLFSAPGMELDPGVTPGVGRCWGGR